MPNTHQIGVKAIIEKEDKILLLKRSAEYKEKKYRDLAEAWDVPGGRLTVGEGLEDGLEREIKEETGLRLESIKRVLDIRTVFRNEAEHIVRITYVCTTYEGLIIVSKEHTEARWFRKEEIEELHYKDSMLRDTLKKYFETKKY